MNKFTIPAILVVTVLVAGIFAFMPVEKASTVHTTLGTTTQSTNILNAELNNVKWTFQTQMRNNATASCGTAGGAFLVYWTLTNDTISTSAVTNAEVNRGLGISNSTGTAADITFNLINQTSMSGVHGGLSGEIIIFSGEPFSDDVGDLSITLVCQSGSTPATTP